MIGRLRRCLDLIEGLLESADPSKLRVFDRAVFALLAWSLFTVGATSLIPLKFLIWSFGTPLLHYIAGTVCIAAALTLNRWVVATAGLWSVFVTINRTFGFVELYQQGSANLLGSISQQVVLGVLTVHAMFTVVAFAPEE